LDNKQTIDLKSDDTVGVKLKADAVSEGGKDLVSEVKQKEIAEQPPQENQEEKINLGPKA